MYTREDLTKQTELLLKIENTTVVDVAQALNVEYKTFYERIKKGRFTYVDYANFLDYLGYEIVLKKKDL